MGHTNQTANYNLPQFVGTDKPSWLGDINDAFAAIDTAIVAAASEASTADGKADALTTTVSGHTTQIGTLQNTVTTQGNTLNTVTSLIGNGTPTTTDQTIIGAINELNAKEGDLSDLTTTDKSSLVAAINEAAAGGGGGTSHTLVAEVTGDGTKTYTQLLTELEALVTDFTKPMFFTYNNDDVYMPMGAPYKRFSQLSVGGSRVYFRTIKLTDHKFYEAFTEASSSTFTDQSSTVVTSGHKLSLYTL